MRETKSKMNSSTRSQIFAAKERLHQLTEETRKDMGKSAGQTQAMAKGVHQKEKTRLEKEKARQEARAEEEANYLKEHNKTVKQVLSQAAKLLREEMGDGSSNQEESEEEEDDDRSESENNVEEATGSGAGIGKEEGTFRRDEIPGMYGKCNFLVNFFFFFFQRSGPSDVECGLAAVAPFTRS